MLEATGVEFEWDFQDAGIDVYEEEGNPLPERTLDSIRERGIAIKGPTTTPVGSGSENDRNGAATGLMPPSTAASLSVQPA